MRWRWFRQQEEVTLRLSLKKKKKKNVVLQHDLLHVTFCWYWVFVICNLIVKWYWCDQFREDGMGETCGTHEKL